MAQVDRTRGACCERLATDRSGSHRCCQLHERQSGVSIGFENPRDLQMGSDCDAGRSVQVGDVGEQKEHQECAPARVDVHSPREIVVWPRLLARKAGVDMPPGVARIVGAGESDREGSDAGTGTPSAFAHQVVVGGAKDGRVHCLPKRFLRVLAKPNDRTGPRRRILRIASRIAPEDFAALIRQLSREGLVHTHKTFGNELTDLLACQRRHRSSAPAGNEHDSSQECKLGTRNRFLVGTGGSTWFDRDREEVASGFHEAGLVTEGHFQIHEHSSGALTRFYLGNWKELGQERVRARQSSYFEAGLNKGRAKPGRAEQGQGLMELRGGRRREHHSRSGENGVPVQVVRSYVIGLRVER